MLKVVHLSHIIQLNMSNFLTQKKKSYDMNNKAITFMNHACDEQNTIKCK